MTAKICLACNRPIKGRSDKKFCDDSCRNNYNNRLNSDITPLMRNINNILRKNRRILEEAIAGSAKSVVVIDKQKLLEMGFRFEYFTEQYTTERSEKYVYCYDYGYRRLDDGKFMVVKDTRKKTRRKEGSQSLINSEHG
jgi:hypothetical protein